jgi:catechol 2,3-dioxygenase-like lactoylglutathione lyase family enzyme
VNNHLTNGAHHIGLTVPNLVSCERFFVETVGYEKVGGNPDYPSVFLHDGTTLITLWQAQDPETSRPFDRRNNVGLHHLALRVADGYSLDQVYATLLRDPEVSIEFAPEPLGEGATQHLMCNIPGGIRIEFIASGA